MKNTRFLLVLLAIVISYIIVGCLGESSRTEQSILVGNKTKGFVGKENFKISSVEDLHTLLTYHDNSYPLVSAHRGGPTEGYPENAIETFAKVSRNNPVIIECDVRLSKDSIMVLMHDETLNRTTTGKGKVSDYTLEELKDLYLVDSQGNKTKYRIPTLEEALIWGKGKVLFTLDVKKDVPYKAISDIIEKVNAKAYSIVITYNANQARALYNINPDLVISASIESERELRQHTEIGIPDNKLIAFVGLSQPNKELVDLLHRHGIKIILGTMGNLDKRAASRGYQVYADYVERGADVISTDHPEEAKKALDYYIRKRKLSSPFINN